MTSSKKRPKKKSVKEKPPADSSRAFEKLLKTADTTQHYSLRLYITGTTVRSNQAITNIRSLCEEYLPGRYDLEVVDIYQQPADAASEQVIAAPTLIKKLPTPIKRLVGNLSDRDKVIVGLNLRDKNAAEGTKWAKI